MDIVTVARFEEWYKKSHHVPYLMEYIRISPALARGICRIRDLLRNEDIRQVYAPSSYLHVTVKELGWLGEDVRKENLKEILGIIGNTAKEQPPFELRVEGVGIFPAAIYGRVGMGAAQIRGMNTMMVERLGRMAIKSQYDGSKMIPHVTIAHFTTENVEPLLTRARKLATKYIGKMIVNEIQVKKSYPHRLFEENQLRVPINEPLANFRLGNGVLAEGHDPYVRRNLTTNRVR